jgi:hypothetical protein
LACIVDRLRFEWLWPDERDGSRVTHRTSASTSPPTGL